jgi:hypothetical protein
MVVFFGLIYTGNLGMINISIGLLSERWLQDDPL